LRWFGSGATNGKGLSKNKYYKFRQGTEP
jgi:hypothetical protein